MYGKSDFTWNCLHFVKALSPLPTNIVSIKGILLWPSVHEFSTSTHKLNCMMFNFKFTWSKHIHKTCFIRLESEQWEIWICDCRIVFFFFTRYKKEALCVEHIHLSTISDWHLYWRASMYFCPYFLYFLIDLGEIWYRSLVISLSHYDFMKISAVKAMMCLGNKENFTHVYYTVAWFG